MNNKVDEKILKLTKDIFIKDNRLENFALKNVYITILQYVYKAITGKQKYVKTELDLIIVLYQLWTNKGKEELTTDSSINITTAKLNELLGVSKTVSSTLVNLKKYSIHEKKVFLLDENGKRYKVGKSYAKEYITVIPDVILFDVTLKEEFLRNDEGEIIGRTTVYTVKPSELLVTRLRELGINNIITK